VPLDLRLVCATHRDLEADVAEGRFREDLYYRVAVVTVRLPPLRERLEDLPALTEAILGRIPRAPGEKPKTLSPPALRMLSTHSWPGNVRELENVLTRASVLAPSETIQPSDLDLGRRPPGARSRSRQAFEAEERERILDMLRSTRWNVSVVSRTLGIPRNTLYRKLERYGLARDAG
jgi:DNA-binding NtrC family response regulator